MTTKREFKRVCRAFNIGRNDQPMVQTLVRNPTYYAEVRLMQPLLKGVISGDGLSPEATARLKRHKHTASRLITDLDPANTPYILAAADCLISLRRPKTP